MSSYDPTVPHRPGGGEPGSGDTSVFPGGASGGGSRPPYDDGDDDGPSLPRWVIYAACGVIALIAFILVVFVFDNGEPDPTTPTTTQPTESTTSTTVGSSTQPTTSPPPTDAPTSPPTDPPTLLPSTLITLPPDAT